MRPKNNTYFSWSFFNLLTTIATIDNEDDTALLKLAKNGYWVDKKGEMSPVKQNAP